MYFSSIGVPEIYKGHKITWGSLTCGGFFHGYVYIIDGDLSRRYATKKAAYGAARCLPVHGPAVTVIEPELF